jgi:hypothetical protein
LKEESVTFSNDRERRGPNIERWDILERIVDIEEMIGKMDFGLKIAVEQPVADNGERLYKRLNAEIRFGRHFIRLNTKGVSMLLQALDEHRDEIMKAMDKVHEDNDQIRRDIDVARSEAYARKGERSMSSRDPRPGEAGGGLGKFSDAGKTNRKRRNRQENGDRDKSDDREEY